jgi:hypothetical protein
MPADGTTPRRHKAGDFGSEGANFTKCTLIGYVFTTAL